MLEINNRAPPCITMEETHPPAGSRKLSIKQGPLEDRPSLSPRPFAETRRVGYYIADPETPTEYSNMAKAYACVLLLLGLVAAVEPKCCFPLMESWMTNIVAGLVYKNGEVMTETATYGRNTIDGLQGSSKFFTNIMTGVVSTVRKVQKYQPGVNATFNTWMIYDEKECTIELKPSAIQNCVPEFAELSPIWYGNLSQPLDIMRRYSVTPVGARPGDRDLLEKTLFVAPGCSLANSLKIDINPTKKFASLVNYANFRVITDTSEFADMFDLPDFCPREVPTANKPEAAQPKPEPRAEPQPETKNERARDALRNSRFFQ
ncbi:uncharacterized protein LOC110977521 [Acanthaster planci]|uniref:Uncharacterized protein LOC110977521 n=1 Tax=Acanthaster planci TaxID=133434 RepID=A0A8B7Y4G8_ACAPL|nr:uncharacterized protein LOC110977521 [Acanthaster planci]